MITSGKEISKTVEELTLDFEQEPPSQMTKMMSGQASQKVMEEINNHIGNGVIEYIERDKFSFNLLLFKI